MTPPKLCGDCGAQTEVNPDLFALPGLDGALRITVGDGQATDRVLAVISSLNG